MVNKELELHGKTVEDIKDCYTWYSDYTMTTGQHSEWKAFCIDLMRKKLRWPKKMAEREFSWLDLAYGLKIQD